MAKGDVWETRACFACGAECEVVETRKGTGHMHCPECRDRHFFNTTREEYLAGSDDQVDDQVEEGSAAPATADDDGGFW